MTTAEALSKILRTPITAAALVAVNGDAVTFNCEPQQRIVVTITNRMLEIGCDQRPEALFVGRRLYEAETKCILKAAECGRKEVSNAKNG